MNMRFSLLSGLFLAQPFFAASEAANYSAEDTSVDRSYGVITTLSATFYHVLAAGGISRNLGVHRSAWVNFQKESRGAISGLRNIAITRVAGPGI